MTTGAAIMLIAAGAILRFALAAGSPHGLNVHTVGVVLILVGVLGLALSLLVRTGAGRPRRLLRYGRAREYYKLPAWDYRLARRRRAAAENVAAIREGEKFFDSGAPAAQDDDL
jgi:hypothetical protein